MPAKKITQQADTQPEAVVKASAQADSSVAQRPGGEVKSDLAQKYRRSADDTGSTEVQIALLSERIAKLTAHLKEHPGDNDSRRGLLLLVGKRRRLLNYLKKDNLANYQKLIADLGLRK